jgi:IS1 family transposase
VNKLPPEKRAQVLGMMVEGISLRSITRLTGAGKNTLARLLVTAGRACAEYQDKTLRGLNCKRVQVDEIWSFVYAKQKNVPKDKRGVPGYGDVWTWTAIDADSKLAVSWLVGSRDGEAAKLFMNDVAGRLANRVQLTSDGHSPYLWAVEDAFGTEIDFAQLVKSTASRPKARSVIVRHSVSERSASASQATRTPSISLRVSLNART